MQIGRVRVRLGVLGGDAGGSDLGFQSPEALGVRVTAAQVTRAAWAALGRVRVLTLVSQALQLLRHPHVG